MPKVNAHRISINYEQHGSGEPLVLIPYLAADHACYAFQVSTYAKHFTCVSLDLRGTGESAAPAGAYSTETLADDVAAFMAAAGIEKAHVAGLSLGGAVGMWLAAKHPDRVLSLSLHSAWTKTDPFLETVVSGFQTFAKAFDSVAEMTIRGIFPWCFTPELYAAKPDYIDSLAAFVRSRPEPSVAAFLEQSDAVVRHDVEAQLNRIAAPTLITFGRHDALTIRFAETMRKNIRSSEVVIFEGCAHAPLYEHVEEFNDQTLRFILRQTIARV